MTVDVTRIFDLLSVKIFYSLLFSELITSMILPLLFAVVPLVFGKLQNLTTLLRFEYSPFVTCISTNTLSVNHTGSTRVSCYYTVISEKWV